MMPKWRESSTPMVARLADVRPRPTATIAVIGATPSLMTAATTNGYNGALAPQTGASPRFHAQNAPSTMFSA